MLKPDISLVVGIGNEYRSDDGVGLFVAKNINDLDLNNVHVKTGISDSAALIETWKSMSRVWLIDCTVSGADPGHLYYFNGITDKIPEKLFVGCSTHNISLAKTIDLARALEWLPSSVLIYGIEGLEFKPGIGLSSEVESTARDLTDRIVREISSTQL